MPHVFSCTPYFHEVAHTLQDSPALSLFLTLGSDLRRRLVSGFCICKAFPLHPAHHPMGPADVTCICQICYVYLSNLSSVFVKVVQCISRLVSGFCIWKSFPHLHSSSQWVGGEAMMLQSPDSAGMTRVTARLMWWNTEDNVCFFFCLVDQIWVESGRPISGCSRGSEVSSIQKQEKFSFSIRQKTQ